MNTLPVRHFNEPFDHYHDRVRSWKDKQESAKKKIRNKKRKKSQEERENSKKERKASKAANCFDYGAYMDEHSKYASAKAVDSSIFSFEKHMRDVSHNKCMICMRVGLSLDMSRTPGKCKDCEMFSYTEDALIKENLLPLWFDDNNVPQYELPEELKCLRESEKMLIQMIHTHVPAHYVKYGVVGTKGHSCAFMQEVNEVCRILPRLPSECNLIRFVKDTSSGVIGEGTRKPSMVRKAVVLNALRWLKRYHIGYKDIEIDCSNLDWMGDKEEAELPAVVEQEEEVQNDNIDLGPSPAINVDPLESENVQVDTAVYVETSPVLPSEEDCAIAKALESSNRNKEVVLNWPSVSDKAVSETTDDSIFTLAFPWLFPGGIGDFKDLRNRKFSADHWARRMMLYCDGRFSTDKIFCFYMLNCCTRRRNMNSGNFFINKFSKDDCHDLQTLCESIAQGDETFLNDITYFSREIRGSDGYWRKKKDQLETWISHHLEMSNRLPNFFITLSCAEYMWADIKRLVEERQSIATGESFKFPDGIKGRTQLINDHALVVQEYFQMRVKEWLKTVGRKVFGIEHHWGRFEFAPSRGQIHVHMICISNDQSMNQVLHELRNDEDAQADALQDWCEKKIGLTADHNSLSHTVENLKEETVNPVCSYYSDAVDREYDLWGLTELTEIHNCNGYCLRVPTLSEKTNYCEEKNIER